MNAQQMNGTPGMQTRTMAFVLYPDLTPLDLIGPLQMLAGLPMASPPYEITVVAEHLGPLPTDVPLQISATQTFGDVPHPTVLLVPGGGPGAIRAMGNDRLLTYVRSAAETAEIVASVCTGALILGAAGLLEGRHATTHWAFGPLLERLGARYLTDRWVEDGRFITSAGVSAGLDMALALGARLTDEAQARQAQLFSEYDPRPPFGGIDWGSVDRRAMVPMIDEMVRTELPARPELLVSRRP